MPNLNPRQAGGIEPVEGTPFAIAKAVPATYSDAEDSGDDSDEDEEMVASTSAAPAVAGAPKKLAKGEGRIERDETGRIVRVVFGGDDGREIVQDVVQRERGGGSDDEESSDEDEDESEEVKPWGEAMADWDGEGSGDELLDEVVVTGPRSTGQGIPIGAGRRRVEAKTQIVRGTCSCFRKARSPGSLRLSGSQNSRHWRPLSARSSGSPRPSRPTGFSPSSTSTETTSHR